MSYLKGKSALMMFDKHANRDKVSGAIGILNKHNEAKKVVNRVYAILTTQYSGAGYKYHETTDNIVNYHNSKSRSLVPLQVRLALNVCTMMRSRYQLQWQRLWQRHWVLRIEAKERKELYFLKNTIKPAILLEVCFVTSEKDATAYRENFEKLRQAIAEELDYTKKVTTTSKAKNKTSSYYKSGTGLYRIKKTCGAYDGVKFSGFKKIHKLKKGEVFTIVDVVRYGSVYRLKTKSGLFITANKEYVEKV